MLMMFADAARLDAIREDLSALGAPGFTVLPVAEGHGRTGVHAGDRVHPGALALVMVIDEDTHAAALLDGLAARRDARGDGISRLYLVPVEARA